MKKDTTSWLKVEWTHTHNDEPYRIYSEIDSDRFEVRKVECFLGGAVGLASRSVERGSTRLGSTPIPDVSEINADAQFNAVEISEEAFNAIWDVYV